jgi:hypothetical protein
MKSDIRPRKICTKNPLGHPENLKNVFFMLYFSFDLFHRTMTRIPESLAIVPCVKGEVPLQLFNLYKIWMF